MTQPLLNDALAAVVMRELKMQPEKCIRVSGRIGGLAHVRYRDGEWQFATWAGAGVKMDGTKEAADVRKLLQSGPQIELLDVENVAIWED